jgi:hypothetical protein
MLPEGHAGDEPGARSSHNHTPEKKKRYPVLGNQPDHLLEQ